MGTSSEIAHAKVSALPEDMNRKEIIGSIRLALVFLARAGIGSALAGGAESSAYNPGLHLGEPVGHWLVLKPIPVMGDRPGLIGDSVRREAFARDWLLAAGGETQVQPRCGNRAKVAGHALKWDPLELNRGSAELLVEGHPVDDAVAYAWAEFEVPGTQKAVLGIGSDDAVKVWLNGKLAHENWTNRPVRLDDDLVRVELRPGRNEILLKIQNRIGPWGFACRVLSQAQADALRSARAGNDKSGTLADGQIKNVLRDCLDIDKLGVGMVVGLADESGSRVISHGKLRYGSAQEVDGNTLFEIGSVTKVFTALLLQDMVERGEMRLERSNCRPTMAGK
jgi:hypothetical protein